MFDRALLGLLLEFYSAVRQRLYASERLYANTLLTKVFTAILERLFDKESHTDKLGSGLIYQVDYALCGVTICKEIVDKEHAVALAEIFAA